MTRLAVLWGPVALVMAAIFAASSIPEPGPLPGDVSGEAAHVAGYALLGAALLRALSGARLSGVTASRAGLAVVLTVLYGVSDEAHQMLVPGRTPDPRDVAADAAGAMLGVGGVAAAAAARRCGILDVDSLLAYDDPDPREPREPARRS